jgi:hypothetical protein
MSHPIVKRFGRGILGEAQNLAPVEAGEATGPGDQQEAQRAHTAEREGVGALPRPGLGGGDGLELEAAQEIVGEDAQVLPDFL